MMKQTLPAALVLAVLAITTGCDPLGPSAEGVVSLGPGVEPAGATSLELRLVPERSTEFSPGDSVVTGNRCDNGNAFQNGISASFAIADVTFPFAYDLSCGIGTSDHSHWRVIAFLHKGTQQAAVIAPGEWFGTSDFTARGCGIGIDGYCGVTTDVDVVLDDMTIVIDDPEVVLDDAAP
jgi:hypothetical protein